MKLAAVGVVIVAILIGLLAWQQAGKSGTNTFADVQANMNNGAILLDVRDEDEFKAGHIVDATHFSLKSIENGETPNVAKNTQLYVYCRSGNRSAQAKQLLENAGFTNITDLGGISDVTAMGGKMATE